MARLRWVTAAAVAAPRPRPPRPRPLPRLPPRADDRTGGIGNLATGILRTLNSRRRRSRGESRDGRGEWRQVLGNNKRGRGWVYSASRFLGVGGEAGGPRPML